MIVGTWLASSLSVDALRKSESQNLEEVATQLRDKIEFDLHEQYSNLKVAAAFTRPHLEVQQPASVTSFLDALHANYPSYAWIGLTDSAGKVVASTGGLLLGADVSQRPWFKQGSQKPYLGDAHKALLLASKLASTGSAPLRLLDLAVPIRSDDGTLLGVLGAHLYLDWVAHMGKDLLTPVQQRLHARFLVADAKGVVIIGPADSIGKTLPDRLVEQSRDVESGYLNTNLSLGSDATDDGEYLVGFSRLHSRRDYASLNWLVMVRKPTSDAFLPAQNLEQTLILVGALVTLAMILFAVAAARWTTRPLLQMAREAGQLDPDKPGTLIRQRDEYEEVRTLSAALRDLIRSLANKTREMNELNIHLEQRVTDRTRALEQANRRLEETVRTDSLTGLNNRRHFFDLGRTAIKRAVRSRTPVTAIMFDADHFKRVNDGYGHGVGDKALVHLGQLARQALREIDTLARVGGEEFAVILENTTEAAAAEVAERLRASIESAPLPLERGDIGLTVSIGVACFQPDSSDDLDDLLVLADKALYRAKADGRNRVCCHSTLAPDGPRS